jgi:hypothetical protein
MTLLRQNRDVVQYILSILFVLDLIVVYFMRCNLKQLSLRQLQDHVKSEETTRC